MAVGCGTSRREYGGFPRQFNGQINNGQINIWVCAVLAVVAVLEIAGNSAAAAAKPAVVLALGDSLTSGWGLEAGQAFPARLEAALRKAGHDVTVVNAGVAGDTTAGARARLGWSLQPKPDAAIVELGANDGLRGIDPAATAANLDAILAELKRRGVAVLLTGMYAPPNLGREFGNAFNAVFPRLAAKHKVAFFPFFLEGVAAVPALNQRDGIHPNAAGVGVIVERIMPYVVRVLR